MMENKELNEENLHSPQLDEKVTLKPNEQRVLYGLIAFPKRYRNLC